MSAALRALAIVVPGVLTLGLKLADTSGGPRLDGFQRAAADTSGGPLLDGFQRAAAYNKCSMRNLHPGHGFNNLPIARKDLNAVYFLEAKVASSTIRDSLGKHGQNAPVSMANFHNYTDSFKFTMVRDPLERLVSAFWEEGSRCVGLQDEQKYHAENPHHREEVFNLFKKFVGELEIGKCWGPHESVQRWRLPNPKMLPMDFVGLVSNLRDDWKIIAQHQASKFQVEWPSLAKPDRETNRNRRYLFNVTHIRPQLAQRACNVYREDYCCFALPVPHACKLDCSK